MEDTADSELTEAPAGQLSDDAFRDELAAIIPHLRAFGRSLSGNRDRADDLVQDTLGKAWAARGRFQAGTNMRAWTFIILRNTFLSQMRRARFEGDYDEEQVERTHSAPASQDQVMELADVQRALLQLPAAQREALILVGAGGFAYEEAAAISGVPVGTVKSRVARGRAALDAILNSGGIDRSDASGDEGDPMAAILAEVDALSAGFDPGEGDDDD